MKTLECAREQDVVEAVLRGRWPPEDDDENDLRTHVDLCPICADVAAVATALRAEHDRAWQEARVPASGQVWWRATIRARAEAACTAARPITMLQAIAGACAVGLCASLFGLAWPSVQRCLTWIGAAISNVGGNAELSALSAAALQRGLLPILVPVAICVVLTPLALYLVLSDD